MDGPPGNIGRHGLMAHLDLFPDVPFLFDDTNRSPERELALGYWKTRQKNGVTFYFLQRLFPFLPNIRFNKRCAECDQKVKG